MPKEGLVGPLPGELLRRLPERPPAQQPCLPGQTSAGVFQGEAGGAGELGEQEEQQESKELCREEPEPLAGPPGLPALRRRAGDGHGGRGALQPSKTAQQERDGLQGSKGNPERPKALHW